MRKNLSAVAAAGTIAFLAACNTQQLPDSTAPTVSLASVYAPNDGSSTTRLTAVATDDVGVTRVEFYAGTARIGEDATAPYTLDLRLASYPNGTANLTARAYDARGNMGVSEPASLFVTRRIGVAGATLGPNATFQSDAAAPGGQVARLGAAGSHVTLRLPSNFVRGRYAMDLSGKADEGGVPSLSITVDGVPYASTSFTSTTIRDFTVNAPALELGPGSTVRVQLAASDPQAIAYVAGLRLVPVADSTGPDPVGDGFKVEVVQSGLKFPSSIVFAPDGSLFILQRGHASNPPGGPFTILDKTRLFRRNMATGAMTEIGGVPTTKLVAAGQETFNGGALGLALDPGFASNGRLYLCYHYESGSTRLNRLSRFQLVGNSLTSELALIDGIPGGPNHNGCRVAVGSDGNVYLTTGDANSESGVSPLSQDINSRAGKILRVTPDGNRPSDNPYTGSFVWSLGHRNPQGLAFDPNTGDLWATEHGEGTDDELNVIERSKNYGWPMCFGEKPTCPEKTGPGTYKPAVKSYYPAPVPSLALSDIAFYTGDAFPAWKGRLLVATLKTRRLLLLTLDGQSVAGEETLIGGNEIENYGRIRDVTVGPDGYIYASTEVTNPGSYGDVVIREPNPLGGMLLRIRPN